MATKIEWCQETWNPITGCSKISPGCANCYAERMAKRLAGRHGYPADDPFKVTFHPDRLEQPLRWKKPRMVFVCSMGDLFHDDVPFEWIDMVFMKICECCGNHTFIILTKRPERMAEWFKHAQKYHSGWFSPFTGRLDLWACWIGITAENQEQYDKRWPILASIPAAVRFVSYEPAIGPLDMETLPCPQCNSLNNQIIWPCPDCGCRRFVLPDWVICGGESGPGARPMHPDWARSLRDQCVYAGVPFFFKQWGEWGTNAYRLSTFEPVFRQFDTLHQWVNKAATWVNGGRCVGIDGKHCERGADFHGRFPVAIMHRVGKKKAGRLLDGRTWDQYPEVA